MHYEQLTEAPEPQVQCVAEQESAAMLENRLRHLLREVHGRSEAFVDGLLQELSTLGSTHRERALESAVRFYEVSST